MFSKILTSQSTANYSAEIDKLNRLIHTAEAIVIGAGAGLSTSAGYTYSGERFYRHFADFAEIYDYKDMYAGGFYPYETLEEYWAYWSRYIYINRYLPPDKTVYQDLLAIVGDKNYFVLTTNVDHCFQRADVAKERLFYTQGDYGLFQCSVPCRQETFDNEPIIREMMKTQVNRRIPTQLIPYCPHCGSPLTMNLRADDKFVEDKGWHEASRRYQGFINNSENKNILFLELGTGYNTPAIIKYPFWRMTAYLPKAHYACINLGQAICPEAIASKAICLNADIGTVLQDLLRLNKAEIRSA